MTSPPLNDASRLSCFARRELTPEACHRPKHTCIHDEGPLASAMEECSHLMRSPSSPITSQQDRPRGFGRNGGGMGNGGDGGKEEARKGRWARSRTGGGLILTPPTPHNHTHTHTHTHTSTSTLHPHPRRSALRILGRGTEPRDRIVRFPPCLARASTSAYARTDGRTGSQPTVPYLILPIGRYLGR